MIFKDLQNYLEEKVTASEAFYPFSSDDVFIRKFAPNEYIITQRSSGSYKIRILEDGRISVEIDRVIAFNPYVSIETRPDGESWTDYYHETVSGFKEMLRDMLGPYIVERERKEASDAKEISFWWNKINCMINSLNECPYVESSGTVVMVSPKLTLKASDIIAEIEKSLNEFENLLNNTTARIDNIDELRQGVKKTRKDLDCEKINLHLAESVAANFKA